jgi:hypothetical protein
VAILAILVVLAHAAVLLGHDLAHQELGVGLNTWQTAYAYSVIVPAPIIAMLMLRRHPREAYALLFVSMLGALLFGAYHHYLAISPDHVDHLPPGDAQGLFRGTALWMAILEAAGAIVAILGLRGTLREPAAAQSPPT